MTIAVIDDYQADRSLIARSARRYWQSCGKALQIDCFPSGETFLAAFQPGRYQYVLLDCCMEGMDGLETAQAMRKRDKNAVLIFITTSMEYAVEGYLVAASGYLVKPFVYEAFVRTLSAVQSHGVQQRAYITLPAAQDHLKVWLDEIIYCDIDGHYVVVHLAEQENLRVRMTFAKLKELVEPYPQFVETFRGCIVNLAHICRVEQLNFIMDSDDRVPFRKREQKKMLRLYADYLFQKVRKDSL